MLGKLSRLRGKRDISYDGPALKENEREDEEKMAGESAEKKEQSGRNKAECDILTE